MTTTIAGSKLATLADQANQSHRLACDAAKSAVAHAIQCGGYLQQAKDSLNHGEFLPWLRENFEGSERSAQQYMKFAANADKITEATSQREAVALLANPQRAADLDDDEQSDVLDDYDYCKMLCDRVNTLLDRLQAMGIVFENCGLSFPKETTLENWEATGDILFELQALVPNAKEALRKLRPRYA